MKRKTTGKSRRPVAKLLLASNNGVHRILGRVRGPICSIVSCRSRLCTHLSLIHFIYVFLFVESLLLSPIIVDSCLNVVFLIIFVLVDWFWWLTLQTRYVMKYRHCDGKLVLKVTDNREVCFGFRSKTLKSWFLFGNLIWDFFSLLQCVGRYFGLPQCLIVGFLPCIGMLISLYTRIQCIGMVRVWSLYIGVGLVVWCPCLLVPGFIMPWIRCCEFSFFFLGWGELIFVRWHEVLGKFVDEKGSKSLSLLIQRDFTQLEGYWNSKDFWTGNVECLGGFQSNISIQQALLLHQHNYHCFLVFS